MAVPVITNAFVGGELAPSLYGRTDIDHYRVSASTFRNGFVNYRGGFYSRGGTAFCAFSKQTGRSYPPRLITFEFSINQGLALEFGNEYTRVFFNGGIVTDASIPITGITQADPGVVTAPADGIASATANNAAVTSSYAPGDIVTMAGGTYSTPGALLVDTTSIASLIVAVPSQITLPAESYAAGDTIHLAGGTQTTAAAATVVTTQAFAFPLIFAAGTGGTDGPVTLTGTTGTGTKFQVSGAISGGALTSLFGIVTGGSYTVNPSNLAQEPVTGGGLSGCKLSVVMGVNSTTLTNAGVFTANPTSNRLTQASTSGAGVGAAFYAIMGPHSLSVNNEGIYSVVPSNPVAQASTTGLGLGATFNLTAANITVFPTGTWVSLSGIGGMTELNGVTAVVTSTGTSTFSLSDVYGNPIDTATYPAYTSGGTASRIFEVKTIYSEVDLPYLKLTQSADVMTLCCVNQETGTEYPAQNLARISDTDWVFTPVVPAATATPPPTATATASSSGSVDYQYVVTTISPVDGTESIASPIAAVTAAVDIASTAGTITVTWTPVAGSNEYYVYKAEPGYSTPPPPGSLFGFAGIAYGAQFIDSNIVADVSQVPPTHQNPFAPGQIIAAQPVIGGAGNTTLSYTISTSTGSGAALTLVLVNGSLSAIIVDDPGQFYAATDTISVTGDGSLVPTATLTIGAEAGTYPGTPAYFQERRVFGYSKNDPDTYWMSQPGAFNNFDRRIPTIDTDAITGSPWSQQVNGIQFMVQTAGGLLVFTGLATWLLVGAGSFATNVEPITPSSQDAVPQAAFGCSSIVPPIKIGYDALYVNSKNSFVYDQPYQLYTLSEPIDLTESSSHLFVNYTIREWAWCEQPYKLVWAVRDDGAMLSLTFYKSQQVSGWARHDTQGLFWSVCSVVELPIDALYTATQRFIDGADAYMIERMDNRVWRSVEDVWAVDCGLSLPQPQPNAALAASSATGLGSVTGGTVIVPGSGYSSATVWSVVDAPAVPLNYQGPTPKPGPGTGAVPTVTLNGTGGVASVTFSGGNQGSGYLNPQLVGADPVNSSGQITAPEVSLILNNSATFTASAAVFAGNSSDIGLVIRVGGGIAEVTAPIDTEHVTANILSPIVDLIPNTSTPMTQAAGGWTLTAPVTTIGGLSHLAGATVTGLADGNVIPPQTVSASGEITLATPASNVVVGLAFLPQLQAVRIDTGAPTVQGQRKKIPAVTVRMEGSRGIQVGTNQPDGASLSPPSLAPEWADLVAVPDNGWKPYSALAQPLFTGDARTTTPGGFATPGQVAVQQIYPLPMQVLALIPELDSGDTPQVKAPPLQQQAAPRAAATQAPSGRPAFLPQSQ